MKTAALIIILFICVFIGIYKNYLLKKRVKELSEFIKNLETIRTEISYGGKNLLSIFSDPALSGCGGIFSEVSSTDKTLYNTYEKIKPKMKNILSIKDSDWGVVDSFFSNVGRSDCENQKKLCDNTVSRLKLQLTDADDTYKKYGKLYTQSGLLIGLFIVILFI